VTKRVKRKISYCITCKNRLWQLRQTLPDNLEAVIADGNSEIVLVNYNSADELDHWIRRFQSHIDSGVLRYVHEQIDPFFHCSIAKNLAHLAATGEFLVNLDGDNFIGDTIPTWRALWMERCDTLIHGYCADGRDLADRLIEGNGTFGRIGLSRKHFNALGGYDEKMHPSAYEDNDLIHRARAYGLTISLTAQSGLAAIRNKHLDTMRYSGSALCWEETRRRNIKRSQENLKHRRLTANRERSPINVLLNFTEKIKL
jgi:Glycosyl transferase family 2